MGFIRWLCAIAAGSAALTSLGLAQDANPDVGSQGVVATPPAVGLTYSMTLQKHQGSVTFTLSQAVPFGSTYAWTFSGCDATPASSTQSGQTVVGDGPGTIAATVTVTTPQKQVLGPYNGQAVLFGGPIVMSSTRSQAREGRTGTFTVSQPWILEWFGQVPPMPDTMETPNTLSGVLVLTNQPTGTTYAWSSGGKIQFVGGSTGSTCQVQATGTSERGAAAIWLAYYYTVGATQYSTSDSSDNYYNIGGVANTGYRKITCHTPSAVNVTSISNENVISLYPGPPIWGMIEHYTMQLWSQLDPFKDIWVQERFSPAPPGYFDDDQDLLPGDFTWNGSDPNNVYKWISGQASPKANEANYNYHAKFIDNIGFQGWDWPVAQPLSGLIPVLYFTHQYFAATSSTTNDDPGVKLDTYTANCYTDQATHTKNP